MSSSHRTRNTRSLDEKIIARKLLGQLYCRDARWSLSQLKTVVLGCLGIWDKLPSTEKHASRSGCWMLEGANIWSRMDEEGKGGLITKHIAASGDCEKT